MRFQGVAIKDHVRESVLFQTRGIVAIVFLVLALGALLTRLFYLQVVDHDHYTTLSENNRVNILPIPPTRGLIYDRNGTLLAQNLPSFTLELIPEHIEDLKSTMAQLRELITITDEEVQNFYDRLKKKRRFEGVPLRFRLSDEEVARISVNGHRLEGVEISAELARHYPLGKLASHAIGYVGRINEQELQQLDASRYSATKHIGKVGVEEAYEDVLHGDVGYQRVETNAQGRILHVIERTLPTPGRNLYLNLDARVQAVAEKAFGEENGALVALDPKTGGVIALVSIPRFDPNLFVNGIDSATYRQLSQSPERPLFNRALKGRYPPGSTIKPFIGLGALELDEIKYDAKVTCPGWYMLKNDDRRYRDWKEEGHGHTDLEKAIVESCDVFFYDLAMALDIDKIHQYLSYFGLGERTGIDIHGEREGILPSRQWKRKRFGQVWFPGETLITGIGQGFMLTTPLQLANVTGTISTYGERHQPRMVYAIEEPQGGDLNVQAPSPLEAVPKDNLRNWDYVLHSMEEVVHGLRGTARGIARNLEYEAAGKTGTAQVFGIGEDEEYDEEKIAKKLRDHALFIGFAPYKNPRIAVAVIVENGGSGGAVAAPIARKVMDAYLLGAS